MWLRFELALAAENAPSVKHPQSLAMEKLEAARAEEESDDDVGPMPAPAPKRRKGIINTSSV